MNHSKFAMTFLIRYECQQLEALYFARRLKHFEKH
jgi:hypothetical protein